LAVGDSASDFACGRDDLDDYLRRRAWANHVRGASRCFVAAQTGRVLGFYALSAGQVERQSLPGRVRRQMPDPIPVIVLARLAVDQSWQGRGLGAGLLKDALVRACAAAEIVGARALVVHAADAAARDFYRHFDFQPFGDDPLHLFTSLVQPA
jgi:ribosomal protein S18 acetylase RimI-like enzyme